MIGVWVADVDAVGALPRAAFGWLSADENRRAARYRIGADRRRYVVSRVLLRGLLAKELGRAPGELRFEAADADGGKPRLAGVARDRVAFNISHAGAAVAIALSTRYEIGIDLEPLGLAVTAGIDPRIWTLGEAQGKLTGEGIGAFPEPPKNSAHVQTEYRELTIGPRAYGIALAFAPLGSGSA